MPFDSLDPALILQTTERLERRIAERFRPPDWSRVDLWVARHLLLQGMEASQVETIVKLASPQFPRRHG
ncbi:MAG: hypothetical protein JNK34_11780, partial [Tabrizicola sp.]|nr:hypothetical protein [Tabrizicola sp.]